MSIALLFGTSKYDFEPFNEVENHTCHEYMNKMRRFYNSIGVAKIFELRDAQFD